MFKALKESYINTSDRFYGPGFINYTNVKSGQVALDDRTRFLSDEEKKALNSDQLQAYFDAVYVVEYEDVYYLILDYFPNQDCKSRVKIHELVLPDTVQGMTSNLHHYNTEAEPILLAYQESFSLKDYVFKNSADAVFKNTYSKIYVYQGEKAQKIITKILEIENFYLADGHHRLFVTQLVKEKQSVLTALVPIEDLSLHAIGRIIPNIDEEKMHRALEFLEKRDMLTEFKELSKGHVHIYWNEQRYSVKLVDLDGDSFWNNDVYRFNTQVLSQAFRIYQSDLVTPLYREEKKDLKKDHAYVYFHPMSSKEFVEIVSKNSILPPKSTYFEPKFPSNLILKRFKD